MLVTDPNLTARFNWEPSVGHHTITWLALDGIYRSVCSCGWQFAGGSKDEGVPYETASMLATHHRRTARQRH